MQSSPLMAQASGIDIMAAAVLVHSVVYPLAGGQSAGHTYVLCYALRELTASSVGIVAVMLCCMPE